MRIVAAPDSYKGSMSSRQAGEAMRAGVRKVWPGAQTTCLQMADGGEGTIAALAHRFKTETTTVRDPLGSPVRASWGWQEKTRTALIESAQAIGMTLVAPGARDVRNASSYGVGQLIQRALAVGAKTIILAVGGTATNDGGAGMLEALGVSFLDSGGNQTAPGLRGLRRLAALDAKRLDERLGEVRVILAADVNNPLTGPEGTTAVYGPQKGIADVSAADKLLQSLAEKGTAAAGADERLSRGAGAGGGIGWAALQFLQATYTSGAEMVAEESGLIEALTGADLVLTGEGSVDGQTLRGKAVTAVLRAAAEQQVPAVVLGGVVAAGAEALLQDGAAAVIPLGFSTGSRELDLEKGPERLELATINVCRLLDCGLPRR